MPTLKRIDMMAIAEKYPENMPVISKYGVNWFECFKKRVRAVPVIGIVFLSDATVSLYWNIRTAANIEDLSLKLKQINTKITIDKERHILDNFIIIVAKSVDAECPSTEDMDNEMAENMLKQYDYTRYLK